MWTTGTERYQALARWIFNRCRYGRSSPNPREISRNMGAPPMMAICPLSAFATIAIGKDPINMNPAPTYHKLKALPCISDGTVSCSTVVPIETMLLVPTTHIMHQDTQNQGDQAKKAGPTRNQVLAQQQQIFMRDIPQWSQNYRCK